MLKGVRENGGVVLTTYGLVTTSAEEFNGEEEFAWDCIICDEGIFVFLLMLMLMLLLLLLL